MYKRKTIDADSVLDYIDSILKNKSSARVGIKILKNRIQKMRIGKSPDSIWARKELMRISK